MSPESFLCRLGVLGDCLAAGHCLSTERVVCCPLGDPESLLVEYLINCSSSNGFLSKEHHQPGTCPQHAKTGFGKYSAKISIINFACGQVLSGQSC